MNSLVEVCAHPAPAARASATPFLTHWRTRAQVLLPAKHLAGETKQTKLRQLWGEPRRPRAPAQRASACAHQSRPQEGGRSPVLARRPARACRSSPPIPLRLRPSSLVQARTSTRTTPTSSPCSCTRATSRSRVRRRTRCSSLCGSARAKRATPAPSATASSPAIGPRPTPASASRSSAASSTPPRSCRRPSSRCSGRARFRGRSLGACLRWRPVPASPSASSRPRASSSSTSPTTRASSARTPC